MYVLSPVVTTVLVTLRFHLSAQADECVCGPSATQCLLKNVNCAERGHQSDLVVCTRCAVIHKVS